MNRTCPSVVAALSILVATGGALGHEIVLDLPDFELAGGESVDFLLDVADDDALGVETMYFSGVFANQGEDGSWASDLQLMVTAPDGQTFTIGGFDSLAGADQWWEFQGAPSEPDGPYASLIQDPFAAPPLPDGTWQFTFSNDRLGSGAHAWTEVELWLIPGEVPAPGGLAILALAGLRGRRRRRGGAR